MKNHPPEYYFSGDQLLLAQAIVSGDLNCVIRLAPHTRLNEPGKQDMTLLFFAIQSGFNRKLNQLNIISQLVKDVATISAILPISGTSWSGSAPSLTN